MSTRRFGLTNLFLGHTMIESSELLLFVLRHLDSFSLLTIIDALRIRAWYRLSGEVVVSYL